MSELVNQLPVERPVNLKARATALGRNWRRLSRDNKSILVIALLAALVAAAIVIILWTASQNYVPLYGKQEMYDTANILEQLEKEQVPFRLDSTSGQVLVPENQLAQIRMALAARGIRAALPAGLESLENISGLGTSEFMETARYRHALEGELARSIISLESIRSARVHLAIPKRTLFVGRDEETPTASVVLDLKPGRALDAGQVEAIANLVAGSIPGMKAAAVSIVDQAGQLLSHDLGDKAMFGKLSVQQMEYVRKLEQYIKQRATDMLYPLLGDNNFRVQIAASVDFNAVEESREKIDPDNVIRSESNKSDKSVDSLALGVPGSLSNQPPAKPTDPNTASMSQTNQNKTNDNRSERNEVNREFENSRSVIHTRYQQGRLQQLSVSVLLNNKLAPKGGWTKEQLTQIQDMVQKAVGFDETRGDQFSLNSFEFNPVAPDASAASEESWWMQPIWQNSLRYLVGGILGLALLLLGIRPLVKQLVRLHHPAQEETSTASVAEAKPLAGMHSAAEANHHHIEPQVGLIIDTDAGSSGHALTEQLLQQDHFDLDNLPEPGSDFDYQLKHLQLLADKETARVAEVIKQWVSGHERS